jgi:hypothetical protein
MLAAYGARVDTVALSSLAHGVVAAVKIFALLEMLGKVVAAAGQFTVETEEPLLLRGEGLRGEVMSAVGSSRREGTESRVWCIVCLLPELLRCAGDLP